MRLNNGFEIPQIEVHPLMTQEEDIAYNHSLGIQVEAWGPSAP